MLANPINPIIIIIIIAQQSAVLEADSLYSSQKREFSAPGSFTEAHQLALSHCFRNFACLWFDCGSTSIGFSMVRSCPMDLFVGGPPSHSPWSSGMDERRGPYHSPPPPLAPIQPQRAYGYQAGPVDTRRDYGPPVSKPSWAD